MVHLLFNHFTGTTPTFTTGLLEDKRQGLVFAPGGLLNDRIRVRVPSFKVNYNPVVSIVICTYERPESLNEALLSLTKQTFKDFEVILITQKGDLSKLRESGLRCARGSIVSFIDDDVYCPATWLEGVVKSFGKGIVGVSGPTIIAEEIKKNRDVFRFNRLHWLHDQLFLGSKRTVPGFLSSCGTPSLASCVSEYASYEGPAEYLEACNMAVLRAVAITAGGFDPNYIKTSEWCEVDLALALKHYGNLIYTPKAALHHNVSQGGVYSERLRTEHRWQNFIYFQKKWEGKYIKKSVRTWAYRGFVWLYLKMKNQRMI